MSTADRSSPFKGAHEAARAAIEFVNIYEVLKPMYRSAIVRGVAVDVGGWWLVARLDARWTYEPINYSGSRQKALSRYWGAGVLFWEETLPLDEMRDGLLRDVALGTRKLDFGGGTPASVTFGTRAGESVHLRGSQLRMRECGRDRQVGALDWRVFAFEHEGPSVLEMIGDEGYTQLERAVRQAKYASVQDFASAHFFGNRSALDQHAPSVLRFLAPLYSRLASVRVEGPKVLFRVELGPSTPVSELMLEITPYEGAPQDDRTRFGPREDECKKENGLKVWESDCVPATPPRAPIVRLIYNYDRKIEADCAAIGPIALSTSAIRARAGAPSGILSPKKVVEELVCRAAAESVSSEKDQVFNADRLAEGIVTSPVILEAALRLGYDQGHWQLYSSAGLTLNPAGLAAGLRLLKERHGSDRWSVPTLDELIERALRSLGNLLREHPNSGIVELSQEDFGAGVPEHLIEQTLLYASPRVWDFEGRGSKGYLVTLSVEGLDMVAQLDAGKGTDTEREEGSQAEGAPTAPPLHPGKFVEIGASVYKMLRCVGRGANAEVWAAELSNTPETRALKVFSPLPKYSDARTLARFQREFETLRRIEHPSVIRVYESGFIDTGRPVFSMELADRDLKAQLLGNPEISVGARIALIRQLFEGLAAVHGFNPAEPVFHRDLKPTNILIAPDGRLLIADLGIAHNEAPDIPAELRDLTTSSEILRNNTCAAPEQAMPERYSCGVGPWSDIYAAGMIAWAVLAHGKGWATGRLPGTSERIDLDLDAALRVVAPLLDMSIEPNSRPSAPAVARQLGDLAKTTTGKAGS